MFAKSIIDSDLFLDMPASTQNLYFHLAMRADDDGFVNSPMKIMRTISCSKNDMDMLVFKQFVIPFESGVCVIKHWKIHNYLRNDRHKATIYTEEKKQLNTDESGTYVLGIPMVDQMTTSCLPSGSIGKDSIGKVRVVEDSEPPPPQAFTLYQNEIGVVSSVITQKLIDDVETFGDEWVCDAIREAAVYNKRNYSYISTILNSWKTSGRGASKVAKTGQAARMIDPEEERQKRERELDKFRAEFGEAP